MKKAKKLLAMLLAMVMLVSAACIPCYAKTANANYGAPERLTDNRKYYFSAEQGCAKILDGLDEMLKDAYIYMTWQELAGDTGGDIIEAIADLPPLNFTSIDNAIDSVYGLLEGVDNLNFILKGVFKLATGDLLDMLTSNGLPGTRRGNRENNYQGNNIGSDMVILMGVLNWLSNMKPLLLRVIAKNDKNELGFGLLNGLLTDIKIAGLPILQDVDVNVEILLYQLLVNENVTAMPEGETLETGLQKIIDWALVTGTGTSEADGGYSILGPNAKPLLGEGIFEKGQISITSGSVYQLVNNLINGLLNNMLAPMLGDLIADLVGVNEDGTLDDTLIFDTVVGALEGLLVQNGANAPNYSDDSTPKGKINDLVKWLFEDGALQVFIKIDIDGIGLTDNFMSLLNDLIRIAINLLPVLGLEIPEGLLPSSDALSAMHYFKFDENGNRVICESTDPDKEDILYLTFTGERECYAIYEGEGDNKEIVGYNYFDTNAPVNIADANNTATYENPKFIRPAYVMPMDEVWAAIVKAVFSLFVEGPYFPEWADTMAEVLAYGCAGLAAPIIPQGDWYDRLDAYHYSGSTDPYTYVDKQNKVVNPIAYTGGNDNARRITDLPTGAMEIISGVAAYYLNSMLDLDSITRFTVEGTSFEQLLTELALWAMITYLPILGGEYDSSTGKVYETTHDGSYGNKMYPGTFAAQTNALIDACYSKFSTRTELADPQWDKIYDYLDSTLLSLVPASWLPEQFYDSRALFNDWLFGNIVNFDLQGLLSLFTANHDGELELPLLTVLLRVIDRVLAIVFGGDALMLPVDRNGTGDNSVFAKHTSITTITALLDDGDGGKEGASLPALVGKLLDSLSKHSELLLTTLFPLIISQSYERPYNWNALKEDSYVKVLPDDMSLYGIQDLEDHITTLSKNVNATLATRQPFFSTTPVEYGRYTNAEDAETAANDLGAEYLDTVTETAEDSTTVYVVNRRQNADDVYDQFIEQYRAQKGEDADTSMFYVDTVERQPATDTEPAIYEFYVYESMSYLDSATGTPATDDAGSYTKYTDFGYRSINAATTDFPRVTWDDDEKYYFWESEDSNPDAYYYSNLNKTMEDADAFVDSYYSFAKNDLCDAYGAWLQYSIDGFVVAADLYDANGDGLSVLSTTDGDYVPDDANTEDKNEETPVDGYPSAPEKTMYPYFDVNDTADFKFVDEESDSYITVKRNSINTTDYEILQMALDYGTDVDNYVPLDVYYTEKVVRYGLWNYYQNELLPETDRDDAATAVTKAMQFDLTPDEKGKYQGSRQWDDLTPEEITSIRNLCAYHMDLRQDPETNEYMIYRQAFGNVAELDFVKAADGVTDVAEAPSATRTYMYEPSDHQVALNAIYDGYDLFVDSVYSMRRSVYNQIDLINWRMSDAERNRTVNIDPTMLKWALDHVKHAYTGPEGKRNLAHAYTDQETNEDVYVKIYTSASYAKFQEAYDFANSLSMDGIGSASGVTQSMVTKAYQGLLAAYNALVLYSGVADWVQYIETLKTAINIKNSDDALEEGSDLALTSDSYDDLVKVINKAIVFGGSPEDTQENKDIRANYDSEMQEKINEMVREIQDVIYNLVYQSNPDIISKADDITVKIDTQFNDKGEHVTTIGWVIGLTEGTGLVKDNFDITGLSPANTRITFTEATFGRGTGAFIDVFVTGQQHARVRYHGILYGDLNGDARIDGTDMTKLTYYTYAGASAAGMGQTHLQEAADVNHDGLITSDDINCIRGHYNYTTDEELIIKQNVHSGKIAA